MSSLVNGMTYVLSNAKNSSYTFKENEGKIMIPSESYKVKEHSDEI